MLSCSYVSIFIELSNLVHGVGDQARGAVAWLQRKTWNSCQTAYLFRSKVEFEDGVRCFCFFQKLLRLFAKGYWAESCSRVTEPQPLPYQVEKILRYSIRVFAQFQFEARPALLLTCGASACIISVWIWTARAAGGVAGRQFLRGWYVGFRQLRFAIVDEQFDEIWLLPLIDSTFFQFFHNQNAVHPRSSRVKLVRCYGSIIN